MRRASSTARWSIPADGAAKERELPVVGRGRLILDALAELFAEVGQNAAAAGTQGGGGHVEGELLAGLALGVDQELVFLRGESGGGGFAA